MLLSAASLLIFPTKLTGRKLEREKIRGYHGRENSKLKGHDANILSVGSRKNKVSVGLQ